MLASVATTMAAFLPLMLLPGIMGKFMFVIPFVVTLALLISLIEAFWMMPVHVSAIGLRFDRPSRAQAGASASTARCGCATGRCWPGCCAGRSARRCSAWRRWRRRWRWWPPGVVRVQFFAFDPIRAFYVNVDMPQDAALEDTLAETQRVEQAVRERLRGVGAERREARAVTSTAGLKFTETEPVYGDLYGQVFVSLNPRRDDSRNVTEVVEHMRSAIETLPGPGRKSFTVLSGGPPAGKAISVKVRGDDFEHIQARRRRDQGRSCAAFPARKDVQDDNLPGRAQFELRLDRDAVRDAGLSPAQVARLIRLAVDGEVIAFTRTRATRSSCACAPTRRCAAPAICASTRPRCSPSRSRCRTGR